MAKKNPYGQIKPGVIKAPNSNPEQPKAKAIKGNDLRAGTGGKKKG